MVELYQEKFPDEINKAFSDWCSVRPRGDSVTHPSKHAFVAGTKFGLSEAMKIVSEKLDELKDCKHIYPTIDADPKHIEMVPHKGHSHCDWIREQIQKIIESIDV